MLELGVSNDAGNWGSQMMLGLGVSNWGMSNECWELGSRGMLGIGGVE